MEVEGPSEPYFLRLPCGSTFLEPLGCSGTQSENEVLEPQMVLGSAWGAGGAQTGQRPVGGVQPGDSDL